MSNVQNVDNIHKELVQPELSVQNVDTSSVEDAQMQSEVYATDALLTLVKRIDERNRLFRTLAESLRKETPGALEVMSYYQSIMAEESAKLMRAAITNLLVEDLPSELIETYTAQTTRDLSYPTVKKKRGSVSVVG